MSFNAKQFHANIILPACQLMSPATAKTASLLLAGTAAVESDFGTYLTQINGPALGPFQMEPATHNDIWVNYIDHRPKLANAIKAGANITEPTAADLVHNLRYAALMARIHYMRNQEAIPNTQHPQTLQKALGAYWKQHYNTPLGKGTQAHWDAAWAKHKLDQLT